MLKKIKRITAYGMIVLLGLNLSGCGLVASTGLTENEEELVAEYAAGVIMRYSADKKGGFGNLKPTPAPIFVPPADEGIEPAEPDDMDSSDDFFDEASGNEDEMTDMSQDMPGQEVETVAGISGILGLDGFDVTYAGYEVADIYPPAEDGVLSFSMQAEEGKKLLVLHFDVTNTGTEDKLCDVLNNNVKFRVSVNGGSRINEQMTILLNDLTSYSETVAAGQKEDTVLVFEVAPSVVEQVNSLTLIMVGNGGESTVNLM